eukprot:563695-Alexandrium_andersonii.AAC.1
MAFARGGRQHRSGKMPLADKAPVEHADGAPMGTVGDDGAASRARGAGQQSWDYEVGEFKTWPPSLRKQRAATWQKGASEQLRAAENL